MNEALIASPVLALITIACSSDGSVRDYEGGSIMITSTAKYLLSILISCFSWLHKKESREAFFI